MEELEKRKQEFLAKAKGLESKKGIIVALVFAVIAWFGYYIRTLNLPLLGGRFIPDVDSYAFLRYLEYIVANGQMMTSDSLRFFPFGYNPASEFGFLSGLVAHYYQLMHFFNPAVKVIDAAIFYPPTAFVAGLIFFFLFVKKLFDYRIALLSSLTLAIMPAYLYRTMAGVFDKEPFGMAMMFAGLAGYAYALKEDKIKYYLVYAVLSGLATGFLGVVWGGVQFFYIAAGLMMVITALFGAAKTKDLHIGILWFVVSQIVISFYRPERTGIVNILLSFSMLPIVIGIFMLLIHYFIYELNLFHLKSKLEKHAPGLVVFVSSLIVMGILASFIFPDAIFHNIQSIFQTMLHPSAETRWAMTVAENHQPFITDWFGQFGQIYIYAALLGAVALFYVLTKKLGKNGLYLTGLFALTLAAFTLTRYSQASPIFNGTSFLSQLLYVGSGIFFIGLAYYLYYKHHHSESIKELIAHWDRSSLLFLCFLLVTLAAGRSLIRLLFVLAPFIAISVSYLVFFIVDEARARLKKDVYKIAVYVIMTYLLWLTLYPYAQSSMGQARGTGLSYDVQWQRSMDWVRANTPEDAVFAHWWDYGYWVQWGGQRATLSDGGNAMAAVNYFVGRHVLTAQTDIEALEFLKARNASYLLMVNDEIGKYPAFSSIGSDVNYDRYSWVPTMGLDPARTQETRNETIYTYNGGTPLDEDFMFNGKIYPAGAAGIAGFTLPVRNVQVQDGNETKEAQTLGQPEVYLVYNGAVDKLPLECMYVNGREILFNDKPGFPACVRLIPTFNGQNLDNSIGSSIYISPRVRRSLFYRYYIAEKQTDNIKLAYSDEQNGMPFAVVNGRLIGPMKIWKLSYDDSIQIRPEYLKEELPDPNVTKVRR